MALADRKIEGHLEGILAHWTRRLTTAFMDGLNSLFSAVKRKARGYRTVEYMTAMLYFFAGKLALSCYYPPKIGSPPFDRHLISINEDYNWD